jgi:uncharacterized membrane protein (DUF4010 family)
VPEGLFSTTFTMPEQWAVFEQFATAILIGALLGIERERRKRAQRDVAIGGLRTFMMFSLAGAIGAWLSQQLDMPFILFGVLVLITIPVTVGYVLSVKRNPDSLGLTTELAAITASLLGAMVMMGHRELAVALAVLVVAILAYKEPLHGVVDRLGSDDVYAGLRLLIATFIILPLLPNQYIDPWNALNPYSLWILVLLISSLSLVGYVATRLLGEGRGIALTGITGGLVSSTAITLSFARQSRGQVMSGTAPALAGGILLSWCVMFARVVIEVLVVNRQMVSQLLVPFACMTIASAVLAWWFLRLSASRRRQMLDTEVVILKNPFSLTQAIKFAAFFAAVLLLVRLGETWLPKQGMYLLAGLAGVTDVDAITLSMAKYAHRHSATDVAVNAIVIASLSNTVVKAGIVVALGSNELRKLMLASVIAILTSAALGLWLH